MRVLKKELWPIKIHISKYNVDEIENWLGEKMGAFKGRWNVVPTYNGADYYFRNTKDASMFALRWS